MNKDGVKMYVKKQSINFHLEQGYTFGWGKRDVN